MSDEEYEEALDEAADMYEAGVTETEPGADASDDEEDLGLDEDAAGTDEETDAEEPAEEFVAEQSQARPARPGADPPTRKSNRSVVAVVVAPDERTTDNVLRRTEAAQVLAMRAQEIAQFATSFVDHEGLHDPVAIAFKELYARRCPLKVRRAVGVGPAQEQLYEEWAVNEMTLPPLTPPLALGPLGAAGTRGPPGGAAAAAPPAPPKKGAPPAPGPGRDLPGAALMRDLRELVSAAIRR